MSKKKPKGWVKEHARHVAAGKGMETGRKKTPVRAPGVHEFWVLGEAAFGKMVKIGSAPRKQMQYKGDPRTHWEYVRDFRDAMTSADRKGWIKVRDVSGVSPSGYRYEHWEVDITPAGKKAYIKGALKRARAEEKRLSAMVKSLEAGRVIEVSRRLG